MPSSFILQYFSTLKVRFRRITSKTFHLGIDFFGSMWYTLLVKRRAIVLRGIGGQTL